MEIDPVRGAMLLERLDHQRCLSDLEITEAIPIAGRLLRRLAIPAAVNLRPLSVLAQEIAQNTTHVVLLCGRYEGVDERVADALVTDEISIGRFSLFFVCVVGQRDEAARTARTG